MGTVCCKNVAITDELVTGSLEDAANSYIKNGQYDMAMKMVKRSLELDIATYGDYSANAAFYFCKMGLIYDRQDNPKEAIKAYQKVIEIFLENKTHEFPSLPNPYLALGKIYYDLEKYRAAITLLETARLNASFFHETEIVNLYSIELYTAKTLSALYSYTEAVTILENLVHKIKRTKGANKNELAEVYESLSDAYIQNEEVMIHEGYKHNFDAKGVAMRQKLKTNTEDEEKVRTASIYINKASEYLEQSLQIKLGLFGEDSVEVARLNIKLSKFKTPEIAKKIIVENLKCLVNRLGEYHPFVYDGYLTLINSQMYITLYDDLKEMFQPCLWSMVNKYNDEYARLAKYYNIIGMVAYIQGRYHEAKEDFNKALKICSKVFGETDPHVADCCELLFVVSLKDRKRREASLNIKRAYQIVASFYGKDHFRALKLHSSISHHEKNHWSLTQEDFTERFNKNETLRTHVDLSVDIDENEYITTDDGRFELPNPVRDVALVGDLTAGSASKKLGCEDCYLLMPDVSNECHFFAVIDGQGSEGKVAADDAKNHLYSFMRKHNELIEKVRSHSTAEKLLKIAMKNVEVGLEKNPKISADSGCCVLGVLIQRGICYSVNVGDCKAIIINYQTTKQAYRNRTIRILADQHRAMKQAELQRVTESGAIVDHTVSPRSFRYDTTSNTNRGTSPRVWRDGSGPGILSTRVLGNFKAKEIGIISDPEINVETIREGDRYIIAATDGLWDVMNEEDVAEFLDKYIDSQVEESSRGVGRAMTQALMQEAKRRWGSKGGSDAGIGDNHKVKAGSDDIALVIAELSVFDE